MLREADPFHRREPLRHAIAHDVADSNPPFDGLTARLAVEGDGQRLRVRERRADLVFGHGFFSIAFKSKGRTISGGSPQCSAHVHNMPSTRRTNTSTIRRSCRCLLIHCATRAVENGGGQREQPQNTWPEEPLDNTIQTSSTSPVRRRTPMPAANSNCPITAAAAPRASHFTSVMSDSRTRNRPA
jgi:hypothetical protein